MHIIYLLFTALIFVSGIVALLVWQKSGVSTEDQAKASITCAGLTQKGKLNDVEGVVKEKRADDFSWETGGVTKIVKVCGDNPATPENDATVFRRRYGGGGRSDAEVPMTYDQLVVGDKVRITGFYTNDSKTTIWPKVALDMSIYRGEDKEGTITQLINATSFKMNVNYKIWGDQTGATVNVVNDPDGKPAKCFVGAGGQGKLMGCTLLEVGDSIKVTGVLRVSSKTIDAWRIEDYSRKFGTTRGKIKTVTDAAHFTIEHAKFFGQSDATVTVELQTGAQCVLKSGAAFPCSSIGAGFVGDDVSAEGVLYESSLKVKASKLTDHSKRVFP